MKPRFRKGVVLLQTLVMSVLLSMIAVMVMKWVLARYLMAARNYRASEARAHSDYIPGALVGGWVFNTSPVPSSGNVTIDGKSVQYSRGTGESKPFTITVGQD